MKTGKEVSKQEETLNSLLSQQRKAERKAEEIERSWSEARHEVDVIFDRMMEMANDNSLDNPLGRAINEYGGQYEAARETEKALRQDYFAAIEVEREAWNKVYAKHKENKHNN